MKFLTETSLYRKAIGKDDLLAEFKATKWGAKVLKKNDHTDFERFAVMVHRKRRAHLLNKLSK